MGDSHSRNMSRPAPVIARLAIAIAALVFIAAWSPVDALDAVDAVVPESAHADHVQTLFDPHSHPKPPSAIQAQSMVWDLVGNGMCQTSDGAHHAGYLPDLFFSYHDGADHTDECKALCEGQKDNGCIGIITGGPNNNCVLELSAKSDEQVVRHDAKVKAYEKLRAPRGEQYWKINGGMWPNAYSQPNGGNRACTSNCVITQAVGRWWPSAKCYKMTPGAPPPPPPPPPPGWELVGNGMCQTSDGAHHAGYLPDLFFSYHDGADHTDECKALCEGQKDNGCIGIITGGPNNNCVLELSAKSDEQVVRHDAKVKAYEKLRAPRGE